jgi:ketosteroid isomerase-like protein
MLSVASAKFIGSLRGLIRSLPVRSTSGLPVDAAASRAAPFSTPLCSARDDNHHVMFDLLVCLANGQRIMGDDSQEKEALIKIQHEWAAARIKGDRSYTQRLETADCTIVWPDGSIVNKRADLESMMGDIVFSEFKIQNVQVRLYGDTGIVVGEGLIKAHKGKQDLLNGKFVWTDTFVKQGGQWKVVASQITPVLEK